LLTLQPKSETVTKGPLPRGPHPDYAMAKRKYTPQYLIPYPEQLKPEVANGHWTAAGKAAKSGFTYCEGCCTYQPKNRRPHVKGWRCDTCYTTENPQK
jgi:hypothetical protein